MIEELKKRKGFIAALDQSGGSSKKTLANYGITEELITNDEVMFDYIHEMRSRIISNDNFNDKYILGVILFKNTMERDINGINTVKYLQDKNIPAFLKIDLGLDTEADGVSMMRDIPNLDEILDEALKYGIIGTKMRSVIKEYNEFGIKRAVDQQFNLAKKIIAKGLVPIIEPEVDINASDKKRIESYLKTEITKHLAKMSKEDYVMFKFTIPEVPNFYDSLLHFKNVVRIVALSGGYDQAKACELLAQNKKMTASFSRALLEGLNVNQSDSEFSEVLTSSITNIYNASVKKHL